MRAYALYLGIDPSTLSKVFLGKRKLPKAMAAQVAEKLGLTDLDSHDFMKSVLKAEEGGLVKPTRVTPFWEEIEFANHSSIVRDWEYYAVLNLVGLDDFVSDVSLMADRLGLSEGRVGKVVSDLLELGFLSETPTGEWVRIKPSFSTIDEVANEDLVFAHISELEIAAEKLQKEPMSRRGAYSSIVKTNAKSVSKLKSLGMEYLEKMTKVLETGPREEVYQLGIQIVPLTKENDNAQV